jgi:hypothetical protein
MIQKHNFHGQKQTPARELESGNEERSPVGGKLEGQIEGVHHEQSFILQSPFPETLNDIPNAIIQPPNRIKPTIKW